MYMTSSAFRFTSLTVRASGFVVDVADYGAGDLIDVKIEGRKDTVLIPFADQYVLEADGTRLVVDLPEGFLEVEDRA